MCPTPNPRRLQSTGPHTGASDCTGIVLIISLDFRLTATISPRGTKLSNPSSRHPYQRNTECLARRNCQAAAKGRQPQGLENRTGATQRGQRKYCAPEDDWELRGFATRNGFPSARTKHADQRKNREEAQSTRTLRMSVNPSYCSGYGILLL